MANGTDTAANQLADVAEKANDVLVSAETIFPLILFPDTITIDRVKMNLTRRQFFRVAEVISIHVDDILNVEADVGPFFGSLKFWTRFYSEQPLTINRLSRSSVIEIKQILQGYIIARHRGIDATSMEKHELIPLLRRLGQETDGEQ